MQFSKDFASISNSFHDWSIFPMSQRSFRNSAPFLRTERCEIQFETSKHSGSYVQQSANMNWSHGDPEGPSYRCYNSSIALNMPVWTDGTHSVSKWVLSAYTGKFFFHVLVILGHERNTNSSMLLEVPQTTLPIFLLTSCCVSLFFSCHRIIYQKRSHYSTSAPSPYN